MTPRHTYVVTVREPDGPVTVKDVSSGLTASLATPAEAGAQIERWLAEPRDDRAASRRRTESQ